MHKLLQRQLAQATQAPDHVDLDILAGLVATAYEEADRDRRRTDRSIRLMIEELQQTNTRLLDAFDVVPEGLVWTNAEGQYVLFNKQLVDLYHSAPETIVVGASYLDSIRAGLKRGHFLDAIGREEEWLAERLTQRKQARSSSEQHIAGDRWIKVEERRTADGGSIGTRVDITDLKRREATLRQRSEQLLDAQRMGKIGDWSYRLDDADFWWSSQIFELLAYDPAKFRPVREAVMAICDGDGAERILATHTEVMRTGNTISIDMKVKRGDGSIGDFAVTSSAATDTGGRVTGLAGTIQDISERKNAEEKLEKLAYYDPLTGLPNRVMFRRELDRAVIRCRGTGSLAALLLIDLDRFKEVNDSLGHGSGDELLGKVAQLISKVLDARHFLCRLGGDEFAIIIRDYADQTAVVRQATKVIHAISNAIRLDRGEVTVGASIGIARIPQDGDDSTDLMRKADLALYRAKESGRACHRFFEAGMNIVAQHKMALGRELRRAVDESAGLEVHYQPQISLSTGRVLGYEALMRWTHQVFGEVTPSEFIPVAEGSRLICDLGLWILRQAAAQAKTWIDAGETAREVSVNVSAAQIWHSDFTADVARTLKETGLPAHLLCLELTESLLADHAEGRVRGVLTELKGLGVTLALDDFGTGYSSLGYLTQLPFDKIKIDRIFIDGAATSERARKLLEGIVALGRGLGMIVVAEGAETLEQVAMLSRLGCDVVQGFVFAHPAAAEEALAAARALEIKKPDFFASLQATRAALLVGGKLTNAA